MRIHALLFFFFCAASCGQSAFALYGGRPAANSAHLVKLQVNQKTICQGVALSETKILTAGHCIEQPGWILRTNPHHLTYYPEAVTVSSGKDAVQAKTITFAPSMFDSHGALAEDLALIELPRPLKGVEVLPLASQNDLVSGVSVLLTTGGEEASVKIRQKVKGEDSLVIVTEGSRSGICQGDSGGALLLVKNGKRYLAGVLAARAEGCARRHSLSYFPRLKFNF